MKYHCSMYVVTIDQRHSRRSADRVPGLLRALTPVPTVLGFERTVGDEVQALLERPEAVVDAVLRAVRATGWSIGVGLGTVRTPLPATSREASGTAFLAARDAVERAKQKGSRLPLALSAMAGSGAPPNATPEQSWHDGVAAATAEAEAVLVLIGHLVEARSAAQWAVLDLLRQEPELPLTGIAKRLEISHQAVGGLLQRSKWHEEQAALPAVTVLLERAARLTGEPDAIG